MSTEYPAGVSSLDTSRVPAGSSSRRATQLAPGAEQAPGALLPRAERKVRAIEMMQTNRYTMKHIARVVLTDAKSVRKWAKEIGWRTPQHLIDAAKVAAGRKSKASRHARSVNSRTSLAVATVMHGMSQPPQGRTDESREAQARAVEHARRCAKLPPIEPGEAEDLVARFIAQRGVTRIPTPCSDYGDGNNFGEGF